MIDLKKLYPELVAEIEKMTKEDFIRELTEAGIEFIDMETGVVHNQRPAELCQKCDYEECKECTSLCSGRPCATCLPPDHVEFKPKEEPVKEEDDPICVKCHYHECQGCSNEDYNRKNCHCGCDHCKDHSNFREYIPKYDYNNDDD